MMLDMVGCSGAMSILPEDGERNNNVCMFNREFRIMHQGSASRVERGLPISGTEPLESLTATGTGPSTYQKQLHGPAWIASGPTDHTVHGSA